MRKSLPCDSSKSAGFAEHDNKQSFHLIFVSMEDWDGLWRRNQFICAELVRRNPDRRILFVGVQRNLFRCLLRGDWRSLLLNATWNVPGHCGITVTTALRVMPERFAWGRKFNEWIIRRHVRRVVTSIGIKKPVLWLNPHSAVHMVGKMREQCVIYDITDDWEKVKQAPALTSEILMQDAELGRLANEVIVCSEALRTSRETKFGRSVHVVANGVDAEHYLSVIDSDQATPGAAQTWARPVLGYTGTLHSQRINVPLVEELAARFTHGSIVLIGPNLLEPVDNEKLGNHNNVYLVGAVAYQNIPDWMRAFDVCIVPHLVTDFTDSLNPIKLWEYLAGGKPIVATPVAGFRDYPQYARLASDADEFASAVNASLTEDRALAEARRAEARKHSWSDRVNAIENIIELCRSRQRP